MSAPGGAEGHISRQSASYRQGLVLGLTMAEVMILLVFCLLIALAAFLKVERDRRVEAETKLEAAKESAKVDRDFVESFKKNPQLSELLKRQPGAGDKEKIDKYWRELIEGASVMQAARENALTSGDLRSRMKDIKALKDTKLDAETIKRDALIAAAVDKAMPPSGSASPEDVMRLIKLGMTAKTVAAAKPSTGGNKWPPIIAINDANGQFFKSGSAEVSPEFRRQLIEGPESTAAHIAKLIKEYDVDVIEVVGHTDEQPVGNRQSNLDKDLVSVLSGNVSIAAITPADNAGLGLARAVSVVRILRESKELSGYKILPLSGGQLINTDETLSLGGNPGDIRERRRIEIRLRKATPRLIEQRQAQTVIQKSAEAAPVMPLPPAKPVAGPSWTSPFVSGPMQLIPPSLFPPSLRSE